MLFRKDYAAPGPGIDPDAPEKTGLPRFLEILQLECITLFKLNLIFILTCLPLVTIPPAIYAMHQVVRRMVLDQPVDCWYHYRTAFRAAWGRGWAAFVLCVLPLTLSGYGAAFYLCRAVENAVFFAPFLLCSTVFLATALASAYLYGILSTGRGIRESLRFAFVLGIGRPLRAALAALCCYGSLLAAVLAFPLSAVYLLLIGFSVPCLISSFFLRTVLKQYFS